MVDMATSAPLNNAGFDSRQRDCGAAGTAIGLRQTVVGRHAMLARICGFSVLLLALVASISPGRPMAANARYIGLDDEVVGKVKEVDAKKKMFVLTLADMSERTFMVNKETKFTGPRGSNREDGLKDDCMSQGYDIRVVPAVDTKFAKEIKLSAWKGDAKAKKKGGA
jgi:hypothetical protein